jgi:Protein of unknown function, DUF488
MMFSRQKALLRLIENEGGSASRLRLVKLAFLLSREYGAPRTGVYQFVPYRRGPFSFTLYHDLRSLVNGGWVVDVDSDIKVLQDRAAETVFLDGSFLKMIDRVSNRYRAMPTPTLVDCVYAAYPWFTMNSDAVHKRAVPRPTAPVQVFTVGYEGIMVDGLLDLLLKNGVERLIDVRCNPIARRYGFHKSTLGRLCQDVDIEYVHFQSLGIPSAWRAGIDDIASYQRLFDRYESEILPSQSANVANVAGLVTERPSALMCMEADHVSCHRSRLAALVSRQTSLPVKELR